MKANFGYAFFILRNNGRFSLRTVLNDNILDLEELEDGDRVIIEMPLSDKSLAAMNAIEKIIELEEITGASDTANPMSELIRWLIERAAESSFLIGLKMGRKEQSELHQEIDDITSKEL